MERFRDRRDLPPWLKMICGATSGIVGQTFCYPLDLVRRRMQMDGFTDASRQLKYDYKNTWSALRIIAKEEGFLALFRGVSINFIKAAPLVGASFLTFDYLKKLFQINPSSKAD